MSTEQEPDQKISEESVQNLVEEALLNLGWVDPIISQCSSWAPRGFIQGRPSLTNGVWCQVGISSAEGNDWMECVDGVTKPPAGGTHYNGLCPSSAADQEISSKDLSPRGDDETVSIADRETVAKATENVRQLYEGGLPSYNDPIWDILAPWALTPFLIKHGIAAIKGDDARQLSESLASDDETASIVDRETVAKALENVRKFLLEHAIKGDDAKELSESLASDDETVSIADRETVAKATENVRQLYAGGLPSYNDPIWDILAPWALTPFLIKHGIAAIKGDDARQLSESLASDDETASIVDRETVAKALENVRKFLLEHAIKGDDAKELSESLASVGKGTSHETDRRLNVVGRFWQSVGDSWTCMAEDFDAFLRSKCPGNKRRMSEEQSTQSIHI